MSAAAGAKSKNPIKVAIETGTFAPVYHLYGDDEYLKEDAVRRLVDAAVDPATRDFNLEIRRGAELDAETLGSLLDTPPMMAERRAVVVRDVGALKKDARAMLDRYLASPASDVVVILTSPAGSKPDKGLGGARVTGVELKPLDGAQLPKWIAYYVEREHKGTITPEAVTLLLDAAGNDLAQLRLELDKLASFAPGRAIDERAVAAVVGVRREETLGAFLDAVGTRDAQGALALLTGVMQQPKVTAVSVVMALATQTLALAWGSAQRERGARVDFFSLLRESGGAYTGRSWGEAVNAWSKMLPHWTLPELDRALDALLHADAALKESRVSSDEQLVANLVLALCARPARSGRRVA